MGKDYEPTVWEREDILPAFDALFDEIKASEELQGCLARGGEMLGACIEHVNRLASDSPLIQQSARIAEHARLAFDVELATAAELLRKNPTVAKCHGQYLENNLMWCFAAWSNAEFDRRAVLKSFPMRLEAMWPTQVTRILARTPHRIIDEGAPGEITQAERKRLRAYLAWEDGQLSGASVRSGGRNGGRRLDSGTLTEIEFWTELRGALDRCRQHNLKLTQANVSDHMPLSTRRFYDYLRRYGPKWRELKATGVLPAWVLKRLS